MSLEDRYIDQGLKRQREAFAELVAEQAEQERADHAAGRCTEDCTPCGIEEIHAGRQAGEKPSQTA